MRFHRQRPNRLPSRLNSEIIRLLSAGCLIFHVAQELHNSTVSNITGNDSDARVKNRAGIEKQWNLR
jgi:hypothetical protein